jgi:hypothetical protein
MSNKDNEDVKSCKQTISSIWHREIEGKINIVLNSYKKVDDKGLALKIGK